MRPLAIAFVGLVLGQAANVLNGNWTANFQGTTYVRLAYAEAGTAPQGTMGIGQSIHVDDEGNVDNVTAASSTPSRMTDIRWNDGVLSFGINDAADVDRFEFRLIDANHAELGPIFSSLSRDFLGQNRPAVWIPLPRLRSNPSVVSQEQTWAALRRIVASVPSVAPVSDRYNAQRVERAKL